MLAEWSAECTADDPVLVVPWSDPNSDAQFIDLRENPYDLDHIPEAEQNPPLMQALRALNAGRSPVFTAKCDAWRLSLDELEDLHLSLYLGAPESQTEESAGFASYIDLVPRDRSFFASVHQQEQFLSRLTRRAVALDHPDVLLDCIVRPALVDFTEPTQGFKEGFSISLYIKAAGADYDAAWAHWAAALEDVISLLRSKEMVFA
jgi:hypothetical protein